MNVYSLFASINTFSTTLGVFAFAFGVIGFVGGAVGYFAKGRADAIIKAQAELIDVRDKQIADKNSQIAALSGENKVLLQSNETLTGLAQGSPQLIAFSREIKRMPKEIAKIIVKTLKDNR